MGTILCIIDGMTDPLFSATDYPCLSGMQLGGYVDTVRGGAPESLTCILHLLGIMAVPPHIRGYVEAVAAGITIQPHDLILRGSWFAVDTNGYCVTPVPAPQHIKAPQNTYQYHFLDGYKSILVFPHMGEHITALKTIPPYEATHNRAISFRPQGLACLEACFEQWLDDGRCLILWGQSVPAPLPQLGIDAAAICGTAVVKGIATLLGMDVIEVSGANGETTTDLAAKTYAALQAAQKYPFVLLHINGMDEAGHRRNMHEKKRFMQHIDRTVFSELAASGHRLIVTADHGVDPQTGAHTAEKQPWFWHGK